MENDAKHIRMTTQPVEKLIVKLAVPTIIIMLVTAMYNTADTYFVGTLGNSATGGVGVSFAVMSIIQAFGFFFGQGAGNFISRALGAKEYDSASKMAVTALICAFGCGCLITLFGLLFLERIALALGSTETILPYAVSYLRFIFIGAPFMVSSITLNHLLRFQGSAVFSMIGLVSGAVLNIALDPLFIFVFKLGTGGASLATIISQAFGCALLFIGCSRGDNVRLRLRNFSPGLRTLLNIVRGGLPSFFRQTLSCVAVIILNNLARQFGDAAIAAVSVVNRIVLISNSVMLGLGQGFQPVCGFNYGAKLYARVKRGFRFCVSVSAALLAVMGVLCFFFAPQIIGIFRDDPEVIRLGTFQLRVQSFIMPLASWIILTNSTMQVTGHAVQATVMSFARQGFFQIPLLLLLVPMLGVRGIHLSAPIADFLTFLVSVPLGIFLLRKMTRLEREAAALPAENSAVK